MATATQSAHSKELDPKQRSSTSRHFEDARRQKIVGQDEAVEALVELFQVFCAGLRSPGRPVGNLLFLGPTGSGKTRIGHDPHIAKAQLHRGDGIEPQSGGRGDARNSRA
jgi:ATP-dependent Clp protease ATP-binding subunit ClpA